MSVISAGFAALVFMLSALVAAIRVHRCTAIWFVVAIPIYTFVSCLIYSLILSSSVHYAYRYSGVDPSGTTIAYWGVSFAVFYVLLNVVGATCIK
jgi:hypothetical protein